MIGASDAAPAGAAPVLRIGAGQTALFASDIHLSDDDPATAQRFFGALREHAPGVSHLFLLGDVFDAWIGDDDDPPLARALADALRSLVATGTAVWLMRGNRDFLLDAALPGDGATGAFTARCGARLLDDPSVIEIAGERVVLTHGDALCTDDGEYQSWRATARDPRWQQAMLARPLAERRAIAASVRARSEAGKQTKDEALMDVNAQAVLALFEACGARRMIHGHTHRPHEHRIVHERDELERIVLPDWAPARGALLRVEGDGRRRMLAPGAA